MSLDIRPHYPVMLNEVLNILQKNKKKIIVDCTFGCGGYSEKILEFFPENKVYGIDRDPKVKKFAEDLNKKYPNRFLFKNEKFSNLEEIIKNNKEEVGFYIFDFGISSFQLDDYSRGFSFNSEEKLDMRMGNNKISAYEIINEAPFEDLSSIIKIFGEDNDHKKIANEIVNIRKTKIISSTKDLRNLIIKAKGNRYYKKDPCTKTFQAIRMIVNQELSEIFNGLKFVLDCGGSETGLIAVTFHSLEDKIVKKVFNTTKDLMKNPSRYIPQSGNKSSNKVYLEKINLKPITPSDDEVSSNNRSRSAKIRSVFKFGNGSLGIDRKVLKMERLFSLEEKYNV